MKNKVKYFAKLKKMNQSFKMKKVAVIVVTLMTCLVVQAAPTSKSNSKVRKFLNLYPRADANKDGTLTTAEMQSFLLRKISSSATSANNKSMKRFLANAPGADLNRDGVLKKSEMIKYLGRL